jgi:hypothetical protein
MNLAEEGRESDPLSLAEEGRESDPLNQPRRKRRGTL